MYCKKCGKQLSEGEEFCENCGTSTKEIMIPQKKTDQEKCLPAFILGLIGSIFGILGGLFTTFLAGAFGGYRGDVAFILIFGGAIVGLIGACKCLNKLKSGSILELLSAIMMIICAYVISGSDCMTVIGLLCMLVGGIIGAIQAFIIKRK